MRAGIALAAGVVLLAIGLVVAAPATLVDSRVAAATNGRLRIADAHGTVWNGSGELVVLPAGMRRSVAWHIDPWPLAFGELQGHVAIDESAAQRADFAYGHRGLTLRRFDLALPMDAVLQSAGVPSALGSAGGSIEAHVERFVQTPGALDADLTMQWRDASLPAPPPGGRIALGDVQLELRGNGVQIAGPLSNRGGDLELAGQVALSAALAPKIEATVRPRAGLDRDRAQAIATALALIGSADGQGGYRIAWPR
jgi:general secretion pathway protein N